MQLTEGGIRPPDLWRHTRSGELSCAYESGESVSITWPAEDVAGMARIWRASDKSLGTTAPIHPRGDKSVAPRVECPYDCDARLLHPEGA
jgi:hypothetical protein